jgi:hypothetical protein
LPLPGAIERGCSIGANHAQNCQLTSSDLKAPVAITIQDKSEHVSTSVLLRLFLRNIIVRIFKTRRSKY